VRRRGAQEEFLPCPCALLAIPGSREALTPSPGSSWRTLIFDAVFQARRHIPPQLAGWGAFEHVKGAPQPVPTAVWGVELPAVVPRELVAACLRMAKTCQACYWQDAWGYARANHLLGGFLLEWADWERGMRGYAGGWLERIEARAQAELHLGGVTVRGLAELAGLSRQHFYRSFLKARRRTPAEFLEQLRLTRAQTLLRDTELPVWRIARHCGYRHLSTFSARFTTLTGLSPLAWRRAERT
jgi:AraC-like DNA-binding protein